MRMMLMVLSLMLMMMRRIVPGYGVGCARRIERIKVQRRRRRVRRNLIGRRKAVAVTLHARLSRQHAIPFGAHHRRRLRCLQVRGRICFARCALKAAAAAAAGIGALAVGDGQRWMMLRGMRRAGLCKQTKCGLLVCGAAQARVMLVCLCRLTINYCFNLILFVSCTSKPRV